MSRRIERLFIQGPVGRLEAILEEPEGALVEAALICHPHPKGGGTMHNKVVHRLARGLRNSGCVVLRFNYRGVNLSEGEYDHGAGEIDDAHTALTELVSRYPNVPVLGAGFSFGSRIVLHLARREQQIQRVMVVGFPTKYPNREYVYEVSQPRYFVQSTNDEFGPKPELQIFYDTLAQPKHIDWIESTDHFFKDNLEGLQQVVERIGNTR